MTRRKFLLAGSSAFIAISRPSDVNADAFQNDLIKMRDYLSTFRFFLNDAVRSGNISQAEYNNLMSIRNSIFGQPACTYFVISNLETLSMNLRLRMQINPHRSRSVLYWMRSYSIGFKWYANQIRKHCASKGIKIK